MRSRFEMKVSPVVFQKPDAQEETIFVETLRLKSVWSGVI